MAQTTAASGERIQLAGLVLLVVGVACPWTWRGLGPGLAGLALLAGVSLWRQAKTRQIAVLPWLLVGFLALSALSMACAEQRLGALREWLQWTVLLVGGWYAGRELGERVRARLGDWLGWALGANVAVGVWQLLWPGAAAALVAVLHGLPYAAGGAGPELAEELALGFQNSQLHYGALVCLTLPFALARGKRLGWRLVLLALAAWTVRPLLLLAVLTWQALAGMGMPLRRVLAVLVIALCVVLRPGPSSLDWVNPYVRTEAGWQPKRLLVEHAAACDSLAKRWLGWGPGTYRDSIRRARIEAEMPRPGQDRVRRDSNGQFLLFAVESGGVAALLFAGFLLVAVGRAGRLSPDDGLAVSLAGLLALGCCTGLLGKGLGPLTGILLGCAWRGGQAGNWRSLAEQVGVLAVAVGLAMLWPNRAAEAAPVAELPATRERIWVEAEDGDALDPVWQTVPEADAGGNRAVYLPSGTKGQTARASYRLVAPAAGRWKLWLRVRWGGGCANSILASVDGAPPVTVEDAIFDRWHWVDVHPNHSFVLPEGEFVFELFGSEDDVAVDQIAFLPDPRDMPVGILASAANTPPPVPRRDFDEVQPQDNSFDKFND
ncbi:MAG: hypothetical protein RBU25_12785 [Lentisphaeria bacterium]|nr:hypothetical protein [Lentisphaeria bacterium]